MKKEYLIAGVVLIIIAVCGAAWYLFTKVLPENTAIVQKNIEREQNTTGVYGKVVAVSPTSLTLEVLQQEGKKNFTFSLDDQTSVVGLSHEDIPQQVAFDKATIAIGEYLNVYTAEPVGSVENQHAVKVMRN